MPCARTTKRMLLACRSPNWLETKTDIPVRQINLKACPCGQAAKSACARCYMFPYCSGNCQVRWRAESARVEAKMRTLTAGFCYWLGSSLTQRLHWRIHREACFGRSIEGQNAMEAAHKKHHDQ